MESNIILNLGLITIVSLSIYFLSRPKLRNNKSWQAMLTPLSSIVGSGFLIMAPLLLDYFLPLPFWVLFCLRMA